MTAKAWAFLALVALAAIPLRVAHWADLTRGWYRR